MMSTLKSSCVRVVVVTVVATALLTTGVGCREAALLAAGGAVTPSTGWSSPGSLAAYGYNSSGASQSGNTHTARGAGGSGVTGGCDGPPYSCPPPCNGPSVATAPVTPSWAGTSMGW